MPGNMKRDQWDVADHQHITVIDQAIELRAVAGEHGAFVEDFGERTLDGDNLTPDHELAAKLLL